MQDRIAALLPSLTPAERRVAELLLPDPQLATQLTIAKLARQAGVSEPTVMRFVRALGHEGWTGFRLAAARQGTGPRPPARFGADLSPEELAAAALDAAAAAAIALHRSPGTAVLAAAARSLTAATRVEIWAEGPPAGAGQALALRLLPLARAVAVREAARSWPAAARGLAPGAAVLVLHPGGQAAPALEEALALAARAGAALLVAAPPADSLLAMATLRLPLPAPPAEAALRPAAGLVALTALAEALALVAARGEDRGREDTP